MGRVNTAAPAAAFFQAKKNMLASKHSVGKATAWRATVEFCNGVENWSPGHQGSPWIPPPRAGWGRAPPDRAVLESWLGAPRSNQGSKGTKARAAVPVSGGGELMGEGQRASSRKLVCSVPPLLPGRCQKRGAEESS